jgi:hypothetical protein
VWGVRSRKNIAQENLERGDGLLIALNIESNLTEHNALLLHQLHERRAVFPHKYFYPGGKIRTFAEKYLTL